jgi:midasin
MNFISQINKESFNLLSIKNWNFDIKFDNLISYFNISILNNNNNFILTETFKTHLKTLLLIIKLSNYAVLLEGPTSVGKTSIVEYLAKLLNQKILRINNNQNTEIEEYLGSYTTDSNGNFYFKEGFLVKAVKEGFWIILDEINLAPSEILEALNRLLDDNRELYLPEKNITIKAHENFRIFAAMNPSENYNGRKDLSDAFKNRFIHIYFDNIPNDELKNIVQLRCNVPESRAKIMIKIFNDLQIIRSNEKIFMKNEGFITIRDLIKWGYRYNNNSKENDYLDLAFEGFFILGEKLSNKEDKDVVKKVIEKNFKENGKNVNLDCENLTNYYRNYVYKKFNIDGNDNNITT